MTATFTAYLAGPLDETFNSHYPGITLTIQEMPQERMETLLNDDARNAHRHHALEYPA
jgi:LysR family cyn operon transcriptional activator